MHDDIIQSVELVGEEREIVSARAKMEMRSVALLMGDAFQRGDIESACRYWREIGGILGEVRIK
jgi:hypothetical protein